MRSSILVSAAAALIGLVPAAPAQAADRFGFTLRSGAVLGNGAATDLTYTATCAPATDGAQATLAVGVAQATGAATVATGSATAAVTCNGKKQTVVVHLFANPDGTAFAPGGFSVSGKLTRSSADGTQEVTHSDAATVEAGTPVIPRDLPGAPYVHVTGAALVAGGAAADVSVALRCPAGQTWHAIVDLRQAGTDGSLAAAQPDTTPAIACTGAEQTTLARIFPQPGHAVFHGGVAVFSTSAASLTGCGTAVCARPADWRTAEITAGAAV